MPAALGGRQKRCAECSPSTDRNCRNDGANPSLSRIAPVPTAISRGRRTCGTRRVPSRELPSCPGSDRNHPRVGSSSAPPVHDRQAGSRAGRGASQCAQFRCAGFGRAAGRSNHVAATWNGAPGMCLHRRVCQTRRRVDRDFGRVRNSPSELRIMSSRTTTMSFTMTLDGEFSCCRVDRRMSCGVDHRKVVYRSRSIGALRSPREHKAWFFSETHGMNIAVSCIHRPEIHAPGASGIAISTRMDDEAIDDDKARCPSRRQRPRNLGRASRRC